MHAYAVKTSVSSSDKLKSLGYTNGPSWNSKRGHAWRIQVRHEVVSFLGNMEQETTCSELQLRKCSMKVVEVSYRKNYNA